MAIIFFIPFLLYIITICPTIYWRDSPEFIDTAYTLGISHPAGSPAYSTISKLFTFLPFSSISFKVNLVSLFFALLTIIFTGKVINILLNHYYPNIKKHETYQIIILCALMLVIMPSFWLNTVIAEVYVMNAFFLVLILFLLFQWSIKDDFRYVLLAAFLYGLSSGVHAGVVFFLPGFLLYFFLAQKNSQCRNLKSFAFVCFFFLIGFSVYLYLPLRSITNPEFDWGNPETFNNFFFHISNRKDSSIYFKNITNITSLLKDSFAFIKITLEEITPIASLLLIAGMLLHFKIDRKGFFLLFLISFVNIFFYFTTTFTDYDSKSGTLFIPSFIIFLIWAGLGIYKLNNSQLEFTPKLNLRKLITPVLLILILFSFFTKYKHIDKSDYYLAENIAKEMYLNIESNSILFSSQYWFHNRYFQDVENLRNDLVVMHIGDIIKPEIYNYVTKTKYPMLNLPEVTSADYSFYSFWPALVKKNINERKIFMDLDSVVFKVDVIPFIPYKKFLMQVVDNEKEINSKEIMETYLKELQISINNDISRDAFMLDQEEGVKTYYNIFLLNFANYLRLKGKYTKALSFLNLAESLTEVKTKGIPLMKGICLAELGKYNESAIIFKNLLNKYPENESILINLGNLYFKMKDYKKAEKYLKNAIAVNKCSSNTHFLIGKIYANENRIEESIAEVKKAINKTKNPRRKNKMENYLNNILKR